MPLKQAPHLYREDTQYRIERSNKAFPVLLSIKRMLRNDGHWPAFETGHESLIDEYNDVVRLSFMGFPEDWKEVLTKKNF